MRWIPASSTTLILAFAAAGVADAGERRMVMMSGSYEVEVRLELPHLEEWAVRKLATICVSDAESTRGLAVLSGNNPLATCPASNIRQEGDALTFDIICEGRNAATASARFLLAPETFRGRIAMVMGGKNMTMTETQVGHRIGTCSANP